MTDSVKEAVEYFNTQPGNKFGFIADQYIRTLITAAQETERLREDAIETINNKWMVLIEDYKTECHKLRARIAELEIRITDIKNFGTMAVEAACAKIKELEKDRPEVVTVEEIMANNSLAHFDTDKILLIGLQYKYPNGLHIVQDKEGGL